MVSELKKYLIHKASLPRIDSDLPLNGPTPKRKAVGRWTSSAARASSIRQAVSYSIFRVANIWKQDQKFMEVFFYVQESEKIEKNDCN